MTGYTLQQVKKYGAELNATYGSATGDILGRYFGYYNGLYWFKN